MLKLDGQDLVCLSCPLGISQTPLVLLAAVAPLLSQFDGTHSVDEITVRFSQYGVQRELVHKLVALLDDHLMLCSPRFYSAERATRDAFAIVSQRPAALAGISYSAKPEELRQEVLRMLALSGQPPPRPGTIRGLIAPHIDYRRGQACYGATYSALMTQKHNLYIMLGTAHQYSKHLFHLTTKDFETPLGLMRCDRDLVAQIAQRYGQDQSFADEFLHCREHSLELQLPFLKHLAPEARIVPILVGSLGLLLHARQMPADCERYQTFAAALTDCVRQRLAAGQNVCILAAVDMAHIGKTFGDTQSLSEQMLKEVERRDRVYLQAIEHLDGQSLFSHIAEDGDQRRVCGFSSVYLLLDVLKRLDRTLHTQIFDYRQAVDYNSDCAVSFAGAGIYE